MRRPGRPGESDVHPGLRNEAPVDRSNVLPVGARFREWLCRLERVTWLASRDEHRPLLVAIGQDDHPHSVDSGTDIRARHHIDHIAPDDGPERIYLRRAPRTRGLNGAIDAALSGARAEEDWPTTPRGGSPAPTLRAWPAFLRRLSATSSTASRTAASPPATRRRVLNAAAELGYSQFGPGRTLKSGRSYVVLFELRDLPVGHTITRCSMAWRPGSLRTT